MAKSVKRVREQWEKLKHIDDSVEHVVRGLAIGVAVGLQPLFGLQMLLAAAITKLTRSNTSAAVTGTWISNPLTYIPIYLFNLEVGLLIFDPHQRHVTDIFAQAIHGTSDIRALGWDVFVAFLLGGLVVGFFGFVLTYILARPLVRRYHAIQQDIDPKLAAMTPAERRVALRKLDKKEKDNAGKVA